MRFSVSLDAMCLLALGGKLLIICAGGRGLGSPDVRLTLPAVGEGEVKKKGTELLGTLTVNSSTSQHLWGTKPFDRLGPVSCTSLH